MKLKIVALVLLLAVACALPAGAEVIRIGNVYALSGDVPVVSMVVGQDNEGGFIVIHFLDQPSPTVLGFADFRAAQHWYYYLCRELRWKK